MEYNGKYYYKIEWECGYSGTDEYEIIESDTPISEADLSDMAHSRWEETCGGSGVGEPDNDEMVEYGFMPDEDDD